jgi:hypothetical protein
MKTTIDIADPLFAEAKRAAEREGTTLKALVDAGIAPGSRRAGWRA